MSIFESRPCRSCFGAGEVLIDADYNPSTGELIQYLGPCSICAGRGTVTVMLYAEPDLRRMADGEILFLCWNGTAREKAMAEKEMRRRLKDADNPLIDDD